MKKYTGILLLLLALTTQSVAEIATGKARPNDLYQHASPYLALHGRDPVRWHEWNQQTVAAAKKQNKLLFVSSGYFSCHWCHVMQRESFQNEKIAALLNKYFIPVKVDRELSSALDARLIDFVQRTQGISGWPLNVFVTPDGYPLVGLVYVPPDNFASILSKLNEQWQQDAAALAQLAKHATNELSKAVVTQSTQIPDGLTEELDKKFVTQVSAYADELQGGFGQENKFPSVPQLQTLLAIYQRQPNEQSKRFLNLTLQQMAALGLRDQLAGGFFRYVVDPAWHVPHFEKMLYDNALLASLYFSAAQTFSEPAYNRVALDTLDFVLRELKTTSGAFAASLSAVDDKGVEGGAYVWDAGSVQQLLTSAEWEVVRRFWQLDGPPELEHGHHLLQTMSLQQVAQELKADVASVTAQLEAARHKMLQVRQQRHIPKDEKQLAAWNGLLLSALVQASRVSGEARYRQAAQQLRDYLHAVLWDGKQLLRAKSAKGMTTDGILEDYAFVIQGVYDWWQLTNDKADQAWLQQLITSAWQRFYGPHGWQLAQEMLLHYGEGSTLVSDGPMPSPASVLIAATYQFARKTENKELLQQALRALNVGHDEMGNDPFWYATQIEALAQIKK